MKRLNLLLAVVLTVAAAAVVIGSQVMGQSESTGNEPIVIEELVRQELTTMDGKETLVMRVRFAPGAAMAAGATLEHPGEEFVYVIDGSALMTPEGDEASRFHAGDAWYNDLSRPHTLQNASSTEPLTVLAIWLGEKGEF